MYTSPTFSQFLSGKLVGLQPDLSSAQGGTYSRVLLEVEGEEGSHAVRSFVSVPILSLRKPEFLGPVLGQDSYDNLKNGLDLDSSTIRALKRLKSVQVEVELETLQRTFQHGMISQTGQNTVRGKDVRLKQIQASGSQDPPVQIPGVGHAADWPENPEVPPFTPLGMPFSRIDSLEGKTRLGYAIIDSPISTVQYQRDTRLETKASLRQQGTMKKHHGFAYESYTLQWIVQGPEEIYNGLQEIYEQFQRCPFISADGGPFGHPGEQGIIPKAVAMRSISVSTVEGLPNALEVSLSLDPFIWSFYIQPAWGKYKVLEYDDALCWPLAKLWCKARTNGKFHGQKLNGHFSLRFPSQELTDQLRALADDRYAGEELVQDVATLRTVKDGLLEGNESYITSRNAKLIRHQSLQDPQGTKLVAIKLEDKAIFDSFLPSTAANNGPNNPVNSGLVIGLMDWRKRLAYHNYTSSDGSFLPQSAYVTDTYLQRSHDNEPLQNIRINGQDLAFLDVVVGGHNIDERIRQQVDSEKAALSQSNINYQSEVARLDMERTDRVLNKHEYYAVVLAVTPQNKTQASSLLQSLIERHQAKVSVRYQSLKQVRNLVGKSAFDNEAPAFVFESGVRNQDILIDRINAVRNHNLAVTSFRGNSLPLHQHVGGTDTVLVVEGHCFSEQAVLELKRVKEEFDTRNLTIPSRKLVADASGDRKSREITRSFMYVDNEVFHLLGVYFAMPVNLSIENVQDQPGVWKWSCTFVEYDPTQYLQEEIRFMETYMNQLGTVYHYGWNSNDDLSENPMLQRAEEYLSLQDSLRDEEVYTDLKLPTIDEFEGWISVCRRLGKDFLQAKNKQLFLEHGLLAGGKDKANVLDPYEREVLQHIRPFLDEANAEAMSNWRDFVGYNRRSNAARYMDPDFFVYYDPVNSWGSVFDSLSRQLMGGPDERNRATGHADQEEGTIPGPRARFIDPNLGGMASVSDPNYFAVIDDQIGSQLNLLDRQSFLPHAQDSDAAVQSVRDQVKAQVEEFDNRKRWWPSENSYTISVATPDDPSSVQLSPEQLRAFAQGILDHRAKNFQETLEIQKGSGGTSAALTESETADGSAIDAFLSLGWRQTKSIEVAVAGAEQPAPTKRLMGSDEGWWEWRAKSAVKGQLATPPPKGFELPFTDGDLELALRLWTNNLLGVQHHSEIDLPAGQNPAMVRAEYLLKEVQASNRTDHGGYLRNTLLLNRNYRSVQGSAGFKVQEREFDANLQNTWDFIDFHSRTKNVVDPHIIRAILLRHDGLGSFKAEASGEDHGFGDFSPQFAVQASPEERTQFLIDKYARYMQEFNHVPSIALMALSMEMRAELRALYLNDQGKIPDASWQKMKTVSQAVSAHRFSREALAQIQDLTQSFPRLADTLDGYFTSYVNLCRSHGTYLLGASPSKQATMGVSDPLFWGFGGLVLADLEHNTNKYVDGALSPSGKSVAIALDRSRVLPYLTNIHRYNQEGKFNPDLSSYDAQLRLNVKLRAALDPHSEAAIYGALVDLRQHSSFGRLAGAFPAYQILLINEGFYVGNTKLWDQHYSRAGVASIEVFRSRKEPASRCNILLSNMFYNLTAYAQMEALQHEVAVRNNKRMGELTAGGKIFSPQTLAVFWAAFIRQMPKELVAIWQNNHMKQLALGVGTRLHIRMGWGSNAAKLPVVFSGTVVNLPAEDGFVELQAVGDGYELNKPTTTSLVQSGYSFAYNDGGALGTGKDPASILAEAMIGASLAENLTQGLFRDFTKGVVHFGEVYFEGARHYATETQINIYSSKNSRLEQQLPMIQNYFNVNALYNYEQVNLFSVDVKEPTLWKIMETCRQACIDFVASAENFTTRSTVFFGKWWWPYNYDFHESILSLSDNVRNKFNGVPVRPTVQHDSTRTQKPTLETQGSQEVVPNTDTPEGRASWDVWNKLPVEAKSRILSFFHHKIPIVKLFVTDSDASIIVFQVYWANLALNNYQYEFGSKKLTQLGTVSTGHPNIKGEQWTVPTEAQPFQVATNSRQQDKDERKEKFFDKYYPEQNTNSTVFGFDYLKDIEVYTQFLKYKTYMQAYIAHSMLNLLENKVEASKDLVFTDAVALHKYNGVASPESLVHTIRYSLDVAIQPQDRRQLVKDTGLVLTTIQSGSKAFAEGLTGALAWGTSFIPVVGNMTEELHNFIQESPTTPAVNNSAVSALVDSAKDMYQGWFVMTGQPTMKPRDMVLLTDHHSTMRGPVFVKDVMHRLDAQNGLITVVSPDCVVYPHGSEFGHQLVMSLSLGVLGKIGGFYLMRGAAALTLGELNHWLRVRSKRLMAGPAGKYERLLQTGVDLDGQKPAVLEAYKKRVGEQLNKELKSLRRPGFTNEDLEDALKRSGLTERIKALEELDDLDQIDALIEKPGLPGLEIDDFRSASPNKARQQILLQELQWARDEKEDIRVAQEILGQNEKDAQATARAHLERKRAAWAAANLKDVDVELAENIAARAGEVDRVEVQRFQRVLTRRDKAVKAIAELEQLKTLTEDQTAELAKLKKELGIHNRQLAKLADSVLLNDEEIDSLVRKAAQGIRNGGLQGFIKRLADGTFGGTVAAAEALSKAAERTVLDEARDARKVARQPSNVSKLRAHLAQIRSEIDAFRALSSEQRLARAGNKMRGAMKFARDLYRAGSLAAYAGPQAILKVALDIVVLTIGSSVVDGINARWKARQCAKIVPLIVGDPGYPLTAGIRGHQGAVIGDEPFWANNLLWGWYKTGDGEDQYVGQSVMTFAAAMMGLEVPDYLPTEQDKQYMQSLVDALPQESH